MMNPVDAKKLVVKVTVKLGDSWTSLGLTSCVVSVRTQDVDAAIARALETLGGGTIEAVVGPIAE